MVGADHGSSPQVGTTFKRQGNVTEDKMLQAVLAERRWSIENNKVRVVLYFVQKLLVNGDVCSLIPIAMLDLNFCSAFHSMRSNFF